MAMKASYLKISRTTERSWRPSGPAVVFSTVFTVLFLFSFTLNWQASEFSNHYRMVYGFVPTLLPLIMHFVPSVFRTQQVSLFLAVACLWCWFLVWSGYEGSYVGLTGIAVSTPLLTLLIRRDSKHPSSKFETLLMWLNPRLRLPKLSLMQVVSLGFYVWVLFHIVRLSTSGTLSLWFAGIVLFVIYDRIDWRKRLGSGFAIVKTAAVILMPIFYVITNYDSYLNFDSERYREAKNALSPEILLFYVDLFRSTVGFMFDNERLQRILLPANGAGEFSFGGDWGWAEYLAEFGLIALIALFLNFHSFLGSLRLHVSVRGFLFAYFWWSFVLLNAHYGIFFNKIGVVSFVIMLYGMRVISEVYLAGDAQR